jgi:hypothetical protein
VSNPSTPALTWRARARRARDAVNRGAVRAARAARLGHYVVLDYPASAAPPGGRRESGRLHDLVAAGEPAYGESLRTLASFEADLARVPLESPDPGAPAWINDFMPGLDAAAIYGFVRSRAPRTYLEVGSGTSTRFARRAIEDAGASTRIVSIDPSPRAEIDQICDVVVRSPLELADREVFAGLAEGDVVFLDGSHRVFAGSDATMFFCDLLPELPAGVLVGVHDVYLPDDYPADIAERHYSEQYLLATLLLGEPGWLRPVLAADYVSRRPALAEPMAPLWARPELTGVETHGVAFWLETAATP